MLAERGLSPTKIAYWIQQKTKNSNTQTHTSISHSNKLFDILSNTKRPGTLWSMWIESNDGLCVCVKTYLLARIFGTSGFFVLRIYRCRVLMIILKMHTRFHCTLEPSSTSSIIAADSSFCACDCVTVRWLANLLRRNSTARQTHFHEQFCWPFWSLVNRCWWIEIRVLFYFV